MSKRMLINVAEQEEGRIAVVDGDLLSELYVERTTNTAALTSVAAGLSVMLIDRALTGGAEPGLVTPAVAGLLAALGVWAIMLPFSKLSRTQPTK